MNKNQILYFDNCAQKTSKNRARNLRAGRPFVLSQSESQNRIEDKT